MKNSMVQVRYHAFFTHRNEPQRAFKARIVPFQFSFGGTKDSVIPMAKKLNRKPQHKDCEQNPFTCRLKKIITNQSYAIQAKHGKLCALNSHSFNKNSFPEAPCNRTSQKPYPKQYLHEWHYYHIHPEISMERFLHTPQYLLYQTPWHATLLVQLFIFLFYPKENMTAFIQHALREAETREQE